MILDFLYISARNILYRKRRSLLTVIGIFIGITAVVALVSLGQGLQDSVEAEFESIGSDKIFINPGGSVSDSSSGNKLTEQDVQMVIGTNAVDQAAGAIFATTTGQYKNEQSFVTVIGTPTGQNQQLVESSWAIEIDEGRSIRSTDTSNIVIGSMVAEQTFGEEIGLRSQITVNGESFRVVGIMKPTGDPSIDQAVMIPRSRAAELIDREDDKYDWIFASVQSGFKPSEAQDEIEEALRQSRNVEEGDEDFTVSTAEDLLSSFNNILTVVRGVVIGIASISLVVGGVGIMNTMYTSVTQRTREIGVMKAIGATNRQVMLLFLLESGIIGAIGGILGVLAGLGMSSGAAYAATQFTNIPINPYIGPELILGAITFSFIVGVVSGVLPARRAAGLQPAEALRYE